jgi:prepilin-type N-terminal cleavage/methylation domain-containing protein
MAQNVRKKVQGEKGFTLIELITALVVFSIISVIASTGLVSVVTGYVFSKKNAESAQCGQVALTRMMKELSATDAISSGGATSITYNSKAPPAQSRSLSWDSSRQALSIGSDALLNNVTSFNISYYRFHDDVVPSVTYSAALTSVVQVVIGVKGADDTVTMFVERIYLSKIMAGV